MEQEEAAIEVKFHPERTVEESDEINALDLAKGIKRMAYACKLTHLIKKADGIIADPDLQNRVRYLYFNFAKTKFICLDRDRTLLSNC